MKQKNLVLMEQMLPQATSLKKAVFRNAIFVFAFSIVLWVSAKVQIPFYPVPLTFQTMVVFIIGMVCGWRLGLAVLAFYYLQGLSGLPVFAGTPEKGIGLVYMAGPTGGYLLGFLLAVVFTGLFANTKIYQTWWKAVPILFIANGLIYLMGVSWLSNFIGWEKSLQFGVLPFLYGDMLKILLASLLVAAGFRFKNKQRLSLQNSHFTVDFFSSKRKRINQRLDEDSLVLIPASSLDSRTIDTPFIQNSSFYYFTSILEPNCLLLLIPYSPVGKTEILFIPKPSLVQQKWTGKMLDKEEARRLSGIEEIEYLENFQSIFQAQQNWKTKLYIENNVLSSNSSLSFFIPLLEEIKKNNPALEIKKLDSELAILRSKKQPLEIAAIEKAINITAQALKIVWQKIPSLQNESQIKAELSYQYQLLGSEGHAFSPIIAGGKNALVLHYEENNQQLEKEALLLMDTGARWQNYSADITRVLPLAKKFSEKQKKYYALVLEIQQRVVEAIHNKMSWWDLYQKAEQIQGQVLKKAGIIHQEKEHKPLTIHRIGHSLGLDVHDICDQNTLLEEGTVLTIEPGLYLEQEAIGIRIEDDYLITSQGVKNLSAKIPKEIKDLEQIF